MFSVIAAIVYFKIKFQHGRLKIRTSEEQKRIKREAEIVKLAKYQAGVSKVLSNRDPHSFNDEIFGLTANLLSANPDIYTMWNIRKETLLYLEKTRYRFLKISCKKKPIYDCL